MRFRALEIGLPLVVALLGLGLLARWLVATRAAAPAPRPVVAKQADDAPRAEATATPEVVATPSPAVTPTPTVATPATPAGVLPGAGNWPRFRGANFDNVSTVGPLARAWPAEGPRKLWSVPLGEGYAGPAVLNGRVYLIDYDMNAQQDVLRCLTLADGREVWRTAYVNPVVKQHGVSRTVPAVTPQYTVSIGPRCHVLCVDTATGAKRWLKDLVRDYGTTVPEWHTGQCPLIDNGRVILAPGGRALMVALDCATGKEVWRTPNPDGWRMTHSSIVPMMWNGTRMYVYPASGGVVGVAADDGRVLWTYKDWVVGTANIPTPVPLGDGRIFLSGGYGAGCTLVQLVKEGAGIGVKELFRLKESTFGSYQQTPIYHNGYIYAVVPNGQLVCLSPDGSVVWKSGTGNRFAWNAYVLAGGMFYLLNDKGELSLVTATPQGFQLLAKAKVLDGPECWAPIAVAGRYLLVRDVRAMACLDIGAR